MKRCIKNKKRFGQKDTECLTCVNYEKCLFIIEFRKLRQGEIK